MRFAAAGLLIAGTGSVFGCLNRPIAPNDPRTTSTIVERLTQSSVDKIDLLLAIDNSGSMADKQEVLALAIPDLVEGLVNPRCIDVSGQRDPVQVGSPNEGCPMGFKREFEPVKDIHIGIISSSIGGHGANSCTPGGMTPASNDDKAHLLARSVETSNVNDLETYLDRGFLAWDPDQKLAGEPEVPDANDGEADIRRDSAADLNDTSLVERLTSMVQGTGQAGCGFEAQLESVYRFLIQPDPYERIELTGEKKDLVLQVGTDTLLLEQRKHFLRPSSLLAVIMLTDENDCSIREEGRYHFVAQTSNTFRLWKPRMECEENPNDPCCRSCSQDQKGCPDQTAWCTGTDGNVARLTQQEDHVNSRCWDQKRRFGFDFLYPIERYKIGFTAPQVPDRMGMLVKNPIFSDLDEMDGDANIRDPGLVFFAGIVGVPWQDIARLNEQGEPDLLNGLNEDGEPVGGFKNANELSAPLPDASIGSTWDLILGDPATYTPPKDPFMIESISPRQGTNPLTGDATVAPEAEGWNEINGREYTIPTGGGDLQYACIFDLREDQDCSTTNSSCDCKEPSGTSGSNNNPLCAPAAGSDNTSPGERSTLQVRAKAYPGIRELQLIKALGSQGIVGSVCPRQLDDANAPDFGYRPAIGAIIDRLKTVLGGQCLPRTLTPTAGGEVSCLILEARNSGGKCNCEDRPSRTRVTPEHAAAEAEIRSTEAASTQNWDCVCEIQQLQGRDEGTPGHACRTDVREDVAVGGQDVHGWCYIDPSIKLGEPALVADCPETERRKIRFIGQGEAQQGATLFITCSGE